MKKRKTPLAGSPAKKRIITAVLRVFLALCVAANIAFIFSNSLKDAPSSSEQSNKLATELAPVVIPGYKPEAPEFQGKLSRFDSVLRSMAHVTEFASLGALCAGFALSCAFRRRAAMLYALCALPVCFAVALTDEYLQTFSPGRSQEWIDVLKDCAGAFAGVAVTLLLALLVRAVAKKHAASAAVRDMNRSKRR